MLSPCPICHTEPAVVRVAAGPFSVRVCERCFDGGVNTLRFLSKIFG